MFLSKDCQGILPQMLKNDYARSNLNSHFPSPYFICHVLKRVLTVGVYLIDKIKHNIENFRRQKISTLIMHKSDV